MIDIGINNNDILVVDKGIFPSNNSIEWMESVISNLKILIILK